MYMIKFDCFDVAFIKTYIKYTEDRNNPICIKCKEKETIGMGTEHTKRMKKQNKY